MKSGNKHKGKPVQVYLDEAIWDGFKRMIKAYDPLLTVSTALKKLIMAAMHDYYIPGYIRKNLAEQEKKEIKVIENKELQKQKQKNILT